MRIIKITVRLISHFISQIVRFWDRCIISIYYKSRMGFCGKNVIINNNVSHPTSVLSRMYFEDNTAIANFHMVSGGGKFYMKKNSGAASNLSIITGNHGRLIGRAFMDLDFRELSDIEKDIIVEEDVWIGRSVILLSGVTIGRGATVGAGSVCIKSIPPYAVVMGNPAKVVGFNFTPEEVIEHEKALYPEDERLPLELLEKNYKKYFLDHIKEIKAYTGLICK